jgi:dipeptidyl aminopeptidase/acylaminoacyl peptidase
VNLLLPLSPETDNHLELTVLMPCLNESASLAICVHRWLATHCREQGARIVPIETRGYSSALRGGIVAARGKYILMGDARRSQRGSTNLWLQQIAGGPPHQLTHFPDDVIAYAWSPDGNRLAVARSTTSSDVVVFRNFH